MIHAEQRALERYGIAATQQDWDALVLAITDSVMGRSNSAWLLGRQNDGTEKWLAPLAGVAVRVVYCPRQARVITVLPPEASYKKKIPVHMKRNSGRRPAAVDWMDWE